MIQLKTSFMKEKEERNDNLHQLGKYFYQLAAYSYLGILLAEVTGGHNIEAVKLGAILMVSFAIMGFTTIYWSNHYKH